jgi:hypothetical protein
VLFFFFVIGLNVNSSATALSLLVRMHCLNAVNMNMQLLVCGVQRNVCLSYVMSFKPERSANLCCTSSSTVVDGRCASVAQNCDFHHLAVTEGGASCIVPFVIVLTVH